MEDSQIKDRFRSIETEIIRLRDRQHELSNKIQPVTLYLPDMQKSVDNLKFDLHNLIPEVAKIQVYVDRIPEFSKRFGTIFQTMNQIEKAIVKQGTKLYFLICVLSFAASAVFAVLMRFLF